MEIVKADRHNLASVIMGKQIQFPWRGQRDVVISVPFSEWLIFIRDNLAYLNSRNPLNYELMLRSEDEGMKIRYFMYDMGWALYSELACSSNTNHDATLILPYFDNGKSVLINDVVDIMNTMTDVEISKCHNSLKAATRNYYNLAGYDDYDFGIVKPQTLSAWNKFVFKVCLFLQSRSSNKIVTEKLNIDWR